MSKAAEQFTKDIITEIKSLDQISSKGILFSTSESDNPFSKVK